MPITDRALLEVGRLRLRNSFFLPDYEVARSTGIFTVGALGTHLAADDRALITTANFDSNLENL